MKTQEQQRQTPIQILISVMNFQTNQLEGIAAGLIK